MTSMINHYPKKNTNLWSDIVSMLFFVSLLCIQPGHAERLKDIATIQGVRNNQLIGYGLVVGLDGTGDQTPYTVQSMISMMQQMQLIVMM